MEHVVNCPQPGCGTSAEIVDRWVWLSTNGPVAHVKTMCVNGHGFTPTLDSLTPPTRRLPRSAVPMTVH
jgi:hypothetical protein